MQISIRMRYFRSPTEKIAAANRPSDDTNRSRMHVNTSIQIHCTIKIAFANLTLFACMCTYSKEGVFNAKVTYQEIHDNYSHENKEEDEDCVGHARVVQTV